VSNLVTGDQRQTGTYAVVAALLGYTAFMFIGSVRERRRRPAEADAPTEHHTTTV
jgi:hypothetical protein